MPVGNSTYPTSIDSLDNLIRTSNDSATTLSASASSADTTLTVGDTSSFPASGTLTIEDEIIYYTGVTATTFTGCTRGQEGTTAASHPVGIEVEGQIIASHHNVHSDVIIKIQTQVGAGAQTIPQQLAALDARLDAIEAAGPASFPGVFLASDYGASGLPDAYTGTISAGSLSQLVLTAASKFEVGHGINVSGAGAAPEPSLVTKVTAVSSDKRTITLAAPAAQAVTATLVWHDDTDAIQQALDAAFAAGTGEVKLSSGIYRVNRKPVARTKSILTLPPSSFFDNAPPTVSLTGTSRQVFQAVFSPQPTSGTIIQTDRADGPDYFIFSPAEYQFDFDWDRVNQSTVGFTGIIFRTYDNPNFSGLDFWNTWNVILKEVQVDTGMSQQGDAIFSGTVPGGAEPTHQSIALRLPKRGTNSVTHLENVSVGNYYTGIVASELIVSVNTSVAKCKVGIQWEDSTHASQGRFLMIHCPVFMKFNAHVALDILVLFENDTDRDVWSKTLPGDFIQDPNNYASGQLRYTFIAAGLSTVQPLPITWTGCERLSIFSLDGHTSKFAPELALSAGSLALSSDLEVKGSTSLTFGTKTEELAPGVLDSGGAGMTQIVIPNLTESTLLTGLVSYWKMEETSGARVDELGLNNFTPTGNIFGMAGKIDNASRSGGVVGDVLAAPHHASQTFAGSFSIAGWLSIADNAPTAGQPAILAKWTQAAGGGDSFAVYHEIQFDAWHLITSKTGSDFFDVNTILAMPLNTWAFVCAVYDHAASEMRISVNGGTPAVTAFTGPVFGGTLPLAAHNFSGASLGPNAFVDEVGLWSRALTAPEIAELYNSGNGNSYPF